MEMKRALFIIIGIVLVLGVVSLVVFFALASSPSSRQRELLEFYGGDHLYPCSLPPTVATWFLHFEGSDSLKTESISIDITLTNSGTSALNVNGKTLEASGKIELYNGNLQRLLGTVRYVEPEIYPVEKGKPANFVLEMKTQNILSSPIKVIGFIRDGM